MHRPTWQASSWLARARAERAQTMAEYATVLGVLIIAVVAAIGVFSSGVDAKLQSDLTTILSGI
jgi:Flp pilus assembly pilin Flp